MKPETHNGVVYLPISKAARKASVGKYIVYDYDWLIDHLEQEFITLCGAKRIRNAYKSESIDKDWED